MKTGYPSTAGVCPKCERETGNLAVHVRACKGPAIPPAPHEQAAIDRASAHAVAPAMLSEAGRFQGTVTDLDVARLVYQLEAGAEVVQGGTGWTVIGSSPLPRGRLSTIVGEALRLGIVSAVSEPTGPAVRKVWIVPAIVHLRPAPGVLVPPCKSMAAGVKRYRMLADHSQVDCLACLDSIN